MSKHDIEFEIGAMITYRPHEKAFPRRVVKVNPYVGAWGQPDERVWYELADPAYPRDVCTHTTGKCIEESKYFDNTTATSYQNYYYHCGEHWELEGDSMHNDRCPVCNKEIEPYDSEKGYTETDNG